MVWDMRNPGQILAILQRNVNTNQRIMFDIDPSGRYAVEFKLLFVCEILSISMMETAVCMRKHAGWRWSSHDQSGS